MYNLKIRKRGIEWKSETATVVCEAPNLRARKTGRAHHGQTPDKQQLPSLTKDLKATDACALTFQTLTLISFLALIQNGWCLVCIDRWHSYVRANPLRIVSNGVPSSHHRRACKTFGWHH